MWKLLNDLITQIDQTNQEPSFKETLISSSEKLNKKVQHIMMFFYAKSSINYESLSIEFVKKSKTLPED
jgi:hypothetical protein